MAETPSLPLIARDVREMRHEIWGNGRPGIKADVQRHDIQIAALIQTQAERHADAKRIMWMLLAQMLATVSGFAVAIALWWITSKGGTP